VTTARATEQRIDVAGLSVHLLEGGTGDPLLLVHQGMGPMGWTSFHERLAETFAVTAPDMPGYGGSERPEWAVHPRDMAILGHLMLDRLDLDRVHLVGLGFGGWIAAEMAAMGQRRLGSLTIVGAPGLRPREGEIHDWLLFGYEQEIRFGFRDDAAFEAYFGPEAPEEIIDVWDYSREMTTRLNWKPWMHSLQLPFVLPAIEVPSLVVWGRHDRLFPLDCGVRYAELLPNARLEIVEDAGHYVELEQPLQLAQLIAAHAEGAR
jgi:pimeloyl-ACP methyl ester carboxylesterase